MRGKKERQGGRAGLGGDSELPGRGGGQEGCWRGREQRPDSCAPELPLAVVGKGCEEAEGRAGTKRGKVKLCSTQVSDDAGEGEWRQVRGAGSLGGRSLEWGQT